MKNVLVVYNNNAGRKKGIMYKKKLHKYLLKEAVVFKFVTLDELRDVDITPYETIVAMGGDGTVNAVIPFVINDKDKTLGIIPCGTANLLAEKLGISANFNKALKVFKVGVKTKIDVLKINDEPCILRMGLGYDADIICKTPQSLKHKFGYFAYFVAGFLFALRLKKKAYLIEVDEQKLVVSASCIIVANASNMYRNLVSVSKGCALDDNLMDVFILKTTNPILFFLELIKMILLRHKNNKNAMYFKTNKLSIKNKWMNAHIDGEKKVLKEGINVDIEKLSVNVICQISSKKRANTPKKVQGSLAEKRSVLSYK